MNTTRGVGGEVFIERFSFVEYFNLRRPELHALAGGNRMRLAVS